MMDAVVATRWLDSVQRTLEPWPWAYTLLVLAALALAAWLANFVTKKILLRGLRKLVTRTPHTQQ